MGLSVELSNKSTLGDNNNKQVVNRSAVEDIANRKMTLESLTLEELQRYTAKENRRMLKNVIVVSVGFLFLFTAFNSVGNLQTSIHAQDGLGSYGNAVIYAALVTSSFLVPTFAIRKLTAKWTVVIAMCGYVPFMGAQFHPTFSTIIPTATLVGLCGAPLWAAKSFYVTHIGNKYAAFMHDESEVILVRFFGIFFCLFQNSHIWGNLLSSLILSSGTSNWNPNSTQLEKCGASFCPGDLFAEEDQEKSKEFEKKVQIFSGICVVIGLIAIIFTSAFLDSLARYGEKERLESDAAKTNSMSQLAATFKQMFRPYQLLLIPLTIFSGLEQSFFGGDFTQAYITCAWGVQYLGYVFICFGIVDATLSIAFGPLLRRVGRLPIFILGTIINIAIILAYFLWKPNPESPVIFFVIAGCWGAADAVWQTQINAFYGYIFPDKEEAAFSNYRVWESVGFIIGYANNNLLCIRPKLYILSSFLALGMTCFLIIEIKERRKRKSNSSITIATTA